MIDPEREGPLDLTALDAAPDPAQADRVIAGAMARVATLGARAAGAPGRGPAALLDAVAPWWYPGLAAAALIVVVTGATILRAPPVSIDRAPDAVVEARLVDWARAGHVPTNRDLLTTFSGRAR